MANVLAVVALIVALCALALAWTAHGRITTKENEEVYIIPDEDLDSVPPARGEPIPSFVADQRESEPEPAEPPPPPVGQHILLGRYAKKRADLAALAAIRPRSEDE